MKLIQFVFWVKSAKVLSPQPLDGGYFWWPGNVNPGPDVCVPMHVTGSLEGLDVIRGWGWGTVLMGPRRKDEYPSHHVFLSAPYPHLGLVFFPLPKGHRLHTSLITLSG